MDKSLLCHREHYAINDFLRHTSNIGDGLSKWENEIISQYFHPEESTLEIGCSGGRVSFGLEKSLGFIDITAIDFVKEFIEIATQEAENRRSMIKFQVGDVLNLNFANESFSQIICTGVVLSHLPHKHQRVKALQELYRVLKPKGKLLINVNNIISDRFYIKYVKAVVNLIRLINNPFGYEPNCIPRLSQNEKPDLFFLKNNRPQLYYYHPYKFICEILDAKIKILSVGNFLTKTKDMDPLHNLRGQWFNVVGEK